MNSFVNTFGFIALSVFLTIKANSQNMETPGLTQQEKSFVYISSFTAQGNIEELKTALQEGLDNGLTLNEINEELVQLYAYCGFPKSLNGITAFMEVVKNRTENGIQDEQGKEIRMNDTVTDKYEQGRKVLEELTGMPQKKPAPGFGEFSPRIDAFLKEHLFADIFSSDVLSYRQQELITIAALASMPGTASQLGAHLFMGINVGTTEDQLSDLFTIIEKTVGKTEAENGRKLLTMLKARKGN
ncbi:MAG: carboxymuconolactone decarboxylase family protein [Saprospiraceae bacterium]|nr:carboxymuconolactone decarboxylase family protein [Saprospiraceae bacterium]HPG07128.1 carboxymuconolactone decarboxylase family protein [Saprospiraceae bacterium]